MEMFLRAKAKAVTFSNIFAGWRGAGLIPSNPKKVLDRLSTKPPPAKRPKYTLPDQITLDHSLFNNLPPEGTKLYYSNVKFTSALYNSNNIPILVYRYADHITYLCETLIIINALQAQ